MIPVQLQPEPEEFDRTVRQPGKRFLALEARPQRWQNREYWRNALPALRQAYGGYCAYFAMKIPTAGGNPTVDHFLPRSHQPQLAYEWSNFRLASALANSYKKNSLAIIDPFTLSPGWFRLDFPSLLTRPNETLLTADRDQVEYTIAVLKLNHSTVRESRKTWVINFSLEKFTFAYLSEEQPFVAAELQRQGLSNPTKLREIFFLS